MKKLIALAAIFLPWAANAALLQVNGSGQLTGATGVDVGGVSYDVSFIDGTCTSVYGSCMDSSFTFNSSAQGLLAATALLDQVFVNSPLGAFHDNPSLTFGCTGPGECYALVPYYSFSGGYGGTYALNRTTFDSTGGFGGGSETDLSNSPGFVHDKYALSSSPVPEPGTWATMLLGFGAIGFAMRGPQSNTIRLRSA